MTTNARAALDGVTILDIATLGAAPMAATFMAEYGANVIKVEDPKEGDPLRNWGPQKNGVGLMWKSISRNKKSVTLNLRVSRGQEILRQLIAKADVLIANFRPPTMKRWGLTYSALQQVNSQLIYLHTTAFGETGPYANKPGFGTLVEAMSGFAHITGEADGPPTLPAMPLGDFITALTGVNAVMYALYHRDVRGGGGQSIDLSILESLSRAMEQAVIEYDQLGTIQKRQGNKWRVTVPRNTYQTSDGYWVAMSGSSPTIANRAFQCIGRPELLDDPNYNTPQARLKRLDEIDAMFVDWIAVRSLREVMDAFESYEVAGAPVYDAEQLLNDPHVVDRETFVTVSDSDLGTIRLQAPVARLSATPGSIRHLGPSLGAHNHEIYAGLLGMSEEELVELETAGVI